MTSFLYGRDQDGRLVTGISFDQLDKFRQEYTKLHMPIDEKIAINQFVHTLYNEAEQDMLSQVQPKSTNN
jgi:hypothetical protein